MLGELFTPIETPEAQNRGFLKGFFGGNAHTFDREELCAFLCLSCFFFSLQSLPVCANLPETFHVINQSKHKGLNGSNRQRITVQLAKDYSKNAIAIILTQNVLHFYIAIVFSFFFTWCWRQLVRQQLGRHPAVWRSTSLGRGGWRAWRWQPAGPWVSWLEPALLWTREARDWGSWRNEPPSWWPVQKPSPNMLMR